LGIKVRLPKSDGYHMWTEDEIGAFEGKHPIGSKARLALALGLYTAQRRGDVVKIGRQHIRDGVLRFRQNKTGATLAIPVHAELQEIINELAEPSFRDNSGNLGSRETAYFFATRTTFRVLTPEKRSRFYFRNFYKCARGESMVIIGGA
jgi:integrase